MGGYRAVVLKGTSSLPKGKVLWEKIRYLKKENAWEEFDPSMDYHFKGRHSNIQNVSASDLEVKIRITHDYPNGDANKPYKESMVVLGKENVGFTGGYYKRIKTQGDFQPTNPNSHLLNNKEAVTQVLNQLLSTGRKGNFKEAKRYCTGKAALSMDKAIKWKSENFYEYSVASGVASAIKVGLQKISFKNNGASADVYLNIQVPRVAKPYVTNINGVRMKIVSDRWKISEFF